MTQDVERIGRLLTEDAVYVERCFDKRATFRGRAAMERYWKVQICGTQTDIQFRHLSHEMVRDADQPIAVVKWLAEFQNRRDKRTPDQTHKRVRFCQMAKLIFAPTTTTNDDVDDDVGSHKICYLEEYAQRMMGNSFRWTGFDATDDELWDHIRFEPPKPPPPVDCQLCGQSFSSRTKLHMMLMANNESLAPPLVLKRKRKEEDPTTTPPTNNKMIRMMIRMMTRMILMMMVVLAVVVVVYHHE